MLKHLMNRVKRHANRARTHLTAIVTTTLLTLAVTAAANATTPRLVLEPRDASDPNPGSVLVLDPQTGDTIAQVTDEHPATLFGTAAATYETTDGGRLIVAAPGAVYNGTGYGALHIYETTGHNRLFSITAPYGGWLTWRFALIADRDGDGADDIAAFMILRDGNELRPIRAEYSGRGGALIAMTRLDNGPDDPIDLFPPVLIPPDAVGSPATTPDLDNNGIVDLFDLLDTLNAMGQPGVPATGADLDWDGYIGVFDLIAVLSSLGQTVPPDGAKTLAREAAPLTGWETDALSQDLGFIEEVTTPEGRRSFKTTCCKSSLIAEAFGLGPKSCGFTGGGGVDGGDGGDGGLLCGPGGGGGTTDPPPPSPNYDDTDGDSIPDAFDGQPGIPNGPPDCCDASTWQQRWEALDWPGEIFTQETTTAYGSVSSAPPAQTETCGSRTNLGGEMIILQGPGHFLLTDCDPPFSGPIIIRNSARCNSAALRHHGTEGSSGFGVEYIWPASASGCPQLKAYTVVGANIYAPGDSTDQPIDTDNDGQPDTRYELATPGSPARIDTDDDGTADTDITINKFARLVPRNDDDTDNNGEPDYLDDARPFDAPVDDRLTQIIIAGGPIDFGGSLNVQPKFPDWIIDYDPEVIRVWDDNQKRNLIEPGSTNLLLQSSRPIFVEGLSPGASEITLTIKAHGGIATDTLRVWVPGIGITPIGLDGKPLADAPGRDIPMSHPSPKITLNTEFTSGLLTALFDNPRPSDADPTKLVANLRIAGTLEDLASGLVEGPLGTITEVQVVLNGEAIESDSGTISSIPVIAPRKSSTNNPAQPFPYENDGFDTTILGAEVRVGANIIQVYARNHLGLHGYAEAVFEVGTSPKEITFTLAAGSTELGDPIALTTTIEGTTTDLGLATTVPGIPGLYAGSLNGQPYTIQFDTPDAPVAARGIPNDPTAKSGPVTEPLTPGEQDFLSAYISGQAIDILTGIPGLPIEFYEPLEELIPGTLTPRDGSFESEPVITDDFRLENLTAGDITKTQSSDGGDFAPFLIEVFGYEATQPEGLTVDFGGEIYKVVTQSGRQFLTHAADTTGAAPAPSQVPAAMLFAAGTHHFNEPLNMRGDFGVSELETPDLPWVDQFGKGFLRGFREGGAGIIDEYRAIGNLAANVHDGAVEGTATLLGALILIFEGDAEVVRQEAAVFVNAKWEQAKRTADLISTVLLDAPMILKVIVGTESLETSGLSAESRMVAQVGADVLAEIKDFIDEIPELAADPEMQGYLAGYVLVNVIRETGEIMLTGGAAKVARAASRYQILQDTVNKLTQSGKIYAALPGNPPIGIPGGTPPPGSTPMTAGLSATLDRIFARSDRKRNERKGLTLGEDAFEAAAQSYPELSGMTLLDKVFERLDEASLSSKLSLSDTIHIVSQATRQQYARGLDGVQTYYELRNWRNNTNHLYRKKLLGKVNGRTAYEPHKGLEERHCGALGLPTTESWRYSNVPAYLAHVYNHRMIDPDGVHQRVDQPLKRLFERLEADDSIDLAGSRIDRERALYPELRQVYEDAGQPEYASVLIEWIELQKEIYP